MRRSSTIDQLLLLQHLVEISAVNLLLNLVVPLTLLNVRDLSVQALIPALILANFNDGMFPVPSIQFVDQRRDEVRVFEGLLDGRQMRARSLAFPRIRLSIGRNAITVGPTCVVYLIAGFFLQEPQEKVAQGIATKPARLVVARALDLRVGLQQLGYLAKHIAANSIYRQVLEQQKGLERCVGGDSGRHPPITRWSRPVDCWGKVAVEVRRQTCGWRSC